MHVKSILLEWLSLRPKSSSLGEIWKFVRTNLLSLDITFDVNGNLFYSTLVPGGVDRCWRFVYSITISS